MEKPLSVMAFDFGTQKIGIAIGQSLTQQARPLETLKAKSGKPDWSVVQALIDQWKPDHLVVGLPLNMDGSESDITRSARKFARRLSHQINQPVEMMDERLSTVNARALHKQGRQQGGKKSNMHSVDAYAAAQIAQAWLDQH